jgi:predicted nucleotide-binding protein
MGFHTLQGHYHFPQVSPKVMMSTTSASLTLPEKFEAIAAEVHGAIALLTPDDIGSLSDEIENLTHSRARQNVIIEIGWIWGKLGRNRCLLLTRGDIEIPSDLSGIDHHTFHQTPLECSEAVRSFINQLELLA